MGTHIGRIEKDGQSTICGKQGIISNQAYATCEECQRGWHEAVKAQVDRDLVQAGDRFMEDDKPEWTWCIRCNKHAAMKDGSYCGGCATCAGCRRKPATAVSVNCADCDKHERGWKLLRRCYPDTMVSTTCPTRGQVTYKPGEWTEPRKGCGPLTVFDTKQDAFRFKATMVGYDVDRISVAPCEYEPDEDNDTVWAPALTGYPEATPEAKVNPPPLAWELRRLPVGTRLAKRVKIDSITF